MPQNITDLVPPRCDTLDLVRGGLLSVAVVCAACKAQIATGPGDGATSADSPVPPDATVLGPWGAAVKVTGASDPTLEEDDSTLATTGLELIFAIIQPNGDKDLFSMTRPTTAEAWTAPTALPFDTADSEATPRLSADGLALYFSSTRPGGLGNDDVYRVTRPAIDGAWGTPALVPGVNSTLSDKWFMPCAAGGYLMIVDGDIAEGTLGAGPPTPVVELSSPQGETGTFLTPDCLTVYFASTRSGSNRLYTSQRTAIGATWDPPAEVTDFHTGGNEQDPTLSADGRAFAFASDAGGTDDIYLSTR